MKKSNFFIVKLTRLFALAAFLIFSAAWAQAAAPANDNFANAQTISGASGQVSITNVEATKETGETAHALNAGGNSVWLKYVAPGNGVLRLQTGSNGWDTTLAVYRGTNLGNLVPVAANDDYETSFGNTYGSKLDFGTQTGTTYYIAVDGHRKEDGTVSTGTTNLYFELQNAAWNDNFSTLEGIGLPSGGKTRSVTTSNVGAGRQVGEPTIAGNPGGKSVWFSLTNNQDHPVAFEFGLEARSTANPSGFVTPLFAVYKGSSLETLSEVTVLLGSTRYNRLHLRAEPHTKYYIAIDTYDTGAGAPTANFTLTYGIAKSVKVPDFDRDGKADLSVYRPTTGTFYGLDSITGNLRGVQWGLNGDKAMFNDLDYDGYPDYFVYRPDTGVWYIFRSQTNTYSIYQWGLSTDVPLTLTRFTNGGVYPYIVVFRPADGTWWFQPPGAGSFVFQFGQTGDVPLTADFNGDGTDEIAVFRPSSGTWYIADPFTGAFIDAIRFGQTGDIPVPADFDGDGFTDIAIFRPSTGDWWFRNRLTGAETATKFGLHGDKPQPADYDNDGIADLAVFRNGFWWIRSSLTGGVRVAQFGVSSDVPVTSPSTRN